MKLSVSAFFFAIGFLILATSCSRYGGHFVRSGKNKLTTEHKTAEKEPKVQTSNSTETYPHNPASDIQIATPDKNSDPKTSGTLSRKTIPVEKASARENSAPFRKDQRTDNSIKNSSSNTKAGNALTKAESDPRQIRNLGLTTLVVGVIMTIVGVFMIELGSIEVAFLGLFLGVGGFIVAVIGVALLIVALITWVVSPGY